MTVGFLFTSLTHNSMIDKIRKIMNNEYELTQEEIKLEDKIWHYHIIHCWGIDTEAVPKETSAEAKRKQKEYNHNYYVTHRKQSTKVLDMSPDSVRRRATVAKYRSRLCEYEGEKIKYSTLMARLHNKLGFSWPDAKKIADEHLVKDNEQLN